MALLFYIEEGARMKITLSLKKSSDFQRILKKGKWSSGDYLSIYVVSNSQEVNFLGVAVSKKGLNSVKRNRIKRLIREAYRHSEENLKKAIVSSFYGKREINLRKQLSKTLIKI